MIKWACGDGCHKNSRADDDDDGDSAGIVSIILILL